MGISRVTIKPTHPLIWYLGYVPLTPCLARGPLEDARVFFGERLVVSYDYLTNPDFSTSRPISDQKNALRWGTPSGGFLFRTQPLFLSRRALRPFFFGARPRVKYLQVGVVY